MLGRQRLVTTRPRHQHRAGHLWRNFVLQKARLRRRFGQGHGHFGGLRYGLLRAVRRHRTMLGGQFLGPARYGVERRTRRVWHFPLFDDARGGRGVAGAISVSVGEDSACALLDGGTATCWGTNAVGELGDGTDAAPDTCLGSPCSPTPVAVLGLTDAIAISVGADSVCALRSGGTVQCWGDNTFGELGTGTHSGPYGCEGSTCPKTPVTVAGLTDAIAISVGTSAACAVLSGGAVRCWGVNDSGQLGDGTHATSWLPVEVEGARRSNGHFFR
jgi:alpha-tubulin suppressor-like RCC1 family protein